ILRDGDKMNLHNFRYRAQGLSIPLNSETASKPFSIAFSILLISKSTSVTLSLFKTLGRLVDSGIFVFTSKIIP
ncbi:MAG: hypothetical protein ACP5E7_07105, partial [Hydrogenobaculum sp.]